MEARSILASGSKNNFPAMPHISKIGKQKAEIEWSLVTSAATDYLRCQMMPGCKAL
jgi:hypothetical protein